MPQRLILPINSMRVTAGYKNSAYKREFGYTHYGVDCTDEKRKDTTVWASGHGIVTHCGWHPSGGNVVVIVYKDCELPTGEIKDIAMRYYHLDKILIKQGQNVTKDTRIAYYGNTGASSGAHLHIECDTDIEYPNYTPQTSKSNAVLKAGIDSTLNPTHVLWCKKSSPDLQYVVSSYYNTVLSLDINYKIFE